MKKNLPKWIFKQTTLIGLLFLFVGLLNGYGQILDGDYCPPAGDPNDEYNGAQHEIIDLAASATCEVSEVWAKLSYSQSPVIDSTDYSIFMGITHGNAGQSNFRLYYNIDCDSTSGQLLAEENLGDGLPIVDVGGAEIMINLTTNNNPSVDIYKWNGSSFEIVISIGAAAAIGNSDGCNLGNQGDGLFIELQIPVLDIFDPCDPNGCGAIELTNIITNAGGSPNSNHCQSIDLEIPIDINEPPTAEIEPVPDCVFEGILVCLDGTPSFDPDGDELEYAWDLSFDGSNFNPEVTGIAQLCVDTFSPGWHKVALSVTDAFACCDTTNTNFVEFFIHSGDGFAFDVKNTSVECGADVDLDTLITTAVAGDTSYYYNYADALAGNNNLTSSLLQNLEENVTIYVRNDDNGPGGTGCFLIDTIDISVGICCLLEVTCPTDWDTTVNCPADIPSVASNELELEALGFIIPDTYCGTLNIDVVTDPDPDCEGTVTRTYTISDDVSSVECVREFTIDMPLPTEPTDTDETVNCYTDIQLPTPATPVD
ncbi:MAG: PKD domain-containing protein, partial [Bacteroidota bacterium]